MKLGGWVMMLVGFMVFLNLVGMSTMFSSTLNSFGISIDSEEEKINADIEGSAYWSKFLLIFTGITAGAVIVGLFASGYDVSLVLAGFVVFIGGLFIGTFFEVISLTNAQAGGQFWITSIVGIIFITLGAGFVMACIDYFGGR